MIECADCALGLGVKCAVHAAEDFGRYKALADLQAARNQAEAAVLGEVRAEIDRLIEATESIEARHSLLELRAWVAGRTGAFPLGREPEKHPLFPVLAEHLAEKPTSLWFLNPHIDGPRMPNGTSSWCGHPHTWRVDGTREAPDKRGRPYCTTCGCQAGWYELEKVASDRAHFYVRRGWIRVERDAKGAERQIDAEANRRAAIAHAEETDRCPMCETKLTASHHERCSEMDFVHCPKCNFQYSGTERDSI